MAEAAYSYKRFKVLAGDKTTTVSMGWSEYLRLVRQTPGGVKAVSKLVRQRAATLHAQPLCGSLSAAVRESFHSSPTATVPQV